MTLFLPSNISCDNPLRNNIREHYLADETAVLDRLIPLAQLSKPALASATHRAIQLAGQVRTASKQAGNIQNLLNQYALSTNEGIVLMCLAEALLRVPDSATADRLIRDKLLSGDWSSHLGGSDSFFVNASSWGLLLSGEVISFNNDDYPSHIHNLKKTLGKLGEPIIRLAMRAAMGIMGTQFVLGRTIAEATQRAGKQAALSYRYSYDMLGEAARCMKDADTYFQAYKDAIEHLGITSKDQDIYTGAGISVKLSAIHPRYEFTQSERVMDELVHRLKELAILAKIYHLSFTIDAEEAQRLDISLDIIEAVFTDPELAGWEGFGMVVQAYQKRALPVLNWLIDLSKRAGKKMMLRLVKGAYWDAEIKLAQVEGLAGYPVFTRKASTDVSYQACAGLLLDNRDAIFPQFATHNAYSVAYIVERAGQDLSGFEFQRLHGMGHGLYDSLIKELHIPVRIYAPVGEHKSLLAYLVRRLLENGANSSFVNNIVNPNIPLANLVADPVAKVQSWPQKNNPHIALPIQLYGDERANAIGLDQNDIPRMLTMAKNTQAWAAANIMPANSAPEDKISAINPSDYREMLGLLSRSSVEQLGDKLAKAVNAHQQWSNTSAAQRALCLARLADKLEQHMDEFIALCCKEAGKVTRDGLAEVREAVDFCRYYANQGRKVCSPHPQWAEQGQLISRGVVLCISPWNFPLAIFLGQVSAALATGNSVLAKPADATGLIASRAVALMADCGFPADVVQLIFAAGPLVGETLLPDTRIAAVMFTGSTSVGNWIAHQIAQRSGPAIPLIAETGGQNCMVVDSTALPEQVVDDVITSGFQSAGQRCSALRVLFLQDDVADEMIEMIVGAMQELQVGDPAYLRTDIGPVIDKKALSALQTHVEYMQSHIINNKAQLIYQCELSDECKYGTFFAPRLYQISHIGLLKQEVFGPVVHVIRYQAHQFEQVLEDINSSGYGLTFGIHSRIQQRCAMAAAKISAGNIYINRNIIGAVVGVQPFGGRGLSGTGPKAGGPSYLYRLVTQKTLAEPMATDTSLAFEFSPHVDVKPDSLSHIKRFLETKPNSECDTQLRINKITHFVELLIKRLNKQCPQALNLELEQQLKLMTQQTLNGQLAATLLPGPTGELNQLLLEPRGNLLCIQQGRHQLSNSLRQIAASLLCGNRVLHVSDSDLDLSAIMAAAGLSTHYHRLYFAGEQPLSELLMDNNLHGIAISGPASLRLWLARKCSERSGALIPLITETNGPAMLQRFSLEKVITNNSTALGGNTILLAISDE